jgi:hypothetical protein
VRRGRNAAWTEEENDRLKAMVAKGVSIARAAVALHRPISSVRNHARALGIPFPKTCDVRKKYAFIFSSDPR